MATCKDCIHYEVCKTEKGSTVFYREGLLEPTYNQVDKLCGALFKDKSRFVELPCKVGDTLYTIVRGHKIRKWIVTDICISEFFSSNGMEITARDKDGSEHIRFAEHYSGKTVFLTIEEAEKAVKEREA